MGLRQLEQELKKQMKQRGLRFNVESKLELEEVIAESCEYLQEAYRGSEAEMVDQYLTETMQNYPEHIEPIREYIEPIAA